MLGLEHKQEIDLSGLSQEEIDALLNLIKAMKRNETMFDSVDQNLTFNNIPFAIKTAACLNVNYPDIQKRHHHLYHYK